MNAFDESKIRRDQIGQFAEKGRAEASGTLAADGDDGAARVIIGEGAEKIAVAQARRELPAGTRVQVMYLGERAARVPEGPLVRTVGKQTTHQMVSFADGDDRGVYLDWAGLSALRDDSGSIIVTNNQGIPFVAFRPLSDGEEPSDDVAVSMLELDDFELAKVSDNLPVLSSLARSSIPGVRARVARNPYADSDALASVVELDSDEETLFHVTQHANVDAATLAAIARSEYRKARYAVAANPSTPVETLQHLAGDHEPGIRSGVARNPRTPLAALQGLAGDRDWDVASSAVSNPALDQASLDRLSRSHGNVRAQVAKNPSTSAETLDRLANDTAQGNHLRAIVAANASAPSKVLARLVADKDDWVRSHAAQNPKLSAVAAMRLARDSESRVRRAIAVHSTDAAAQAALVSDTDPFVRSDLARHTKHEAVLRALMLDEHHATRSNLAGNASAPVDVLQHLAKEDGVVGARAQTTLRERS